MCFLGLFTPTTRAHQIISAKLNGIAVVSLSKEHELLPLQVKEFNKENEDDNIEIPNRRTILPIPEVTMQGNTLHFITPCEGYDFRLVQGNTVCHNEEISGDTLTLPANLSGTYELQIVSEDYIFYTEVTL